MKKHRIFVFTLMAIALVIVSFLVRKDLSFLKWRDLSSESFENYPPIQRLHVPEITCPVDKDNDGLDDLKDIVAGARAEVNRKPQYRSAYYQGGYPPGNEGVCTDVVWRAFQDAGYDLKKLVDKDIREHLADYPRVEGKPDQNIDFRRVPNLIVFFKRNSQELIREVKPGDVENLSQWQAGDIVTFADPYEHIGIISDKRRSDGVPYIIHNAGPIPKESDQLQSWPSPITGHFRLPRV